MNDFLVWALFMLLMLAIICMAHGVLWLYKYIRGRIKRGKVLSYPVDRSEGRRWG